MTGLRWEADAAAVLPPYVYDYFRATAGSLDVLADQTAAWDRIRHRPRILRGSDGVDTSTTVLGADVRSPILIAPMAQQVAADPAGEVATAAGARAAGSLLGVSTNTAVAFNSIASAGAPWWFQLYLMRDRELSGALLDRAVAAGALAIILTVDVTTLTHPTPGADYSVDPTAWTDVTRGNRVVANLAEAEWVALRGPGGQPDHDVGLDAIEWVASRTGLPVIVKGVLRGDDARLCVDAGAAGIVVSTHGARCLATAVPTAYALPEVVQAVDGQVQVFVDSGLRSGSHVASALAMGARAVFVGRPVLWKLATHGAAGVAEALNTLTAELAQTMQLLGVASIAELTPDLLA